MEITKEVLNARLDKALGAREVKLVELSQIDGIIDDLKYWKEYLEKEPEIQEDEGQSLNKAGPDIS